MTQTPTDALRLVPKYYATEPKEGGGGGYWEASIELTGGDYIAAEIYGNDREEVEERLKAALSGLLAAPASPLPGDGLPADVVRLVIAARRVAYEGAAEDDLRALDIAAEAFASRVPWDDEPDELPAAPTGAK